VLTGILLYPSIGISSFSLGVLIGSFFSHWVLQWWGLKKLGYSIKPYFSLPDEVKNSLKQYMWLSLPLAFGFSLVVTDEWFGKYFASSMESRSISWLSYARTAMRIPIAVVGQVAAIASFPYLTRLWEQKDYGTYFETLMREVMKLWALAPLAALFMYFEAEPIVHFLYGSGRFSPEDIASTAAGLRYFSLGIVFWVYQILFSRAFFACRKTWLPSLLGGLMSIFAFPLYFYLGKNFFYQGLAVASSLSIFIYSLVLFFLWVIWMRKHHVFSFFRYVKFFFLWSCILVFLGFILLGMQKIGIYQNTRMSALSEILLLLTVLLGLALGLLRVFFQKDVGRVF
jgi:putative peptidoglycan lipid II flippase